MKLYETRTFALLDGPWAGATGSAGRFKIQTFALLFFLTSDIHEQRGGVGNYDAKFR